jgi:phosphoglycerate kinase
MQLPSIKDLKVKGKRILVRCDLDVPLKEIKNNERINYRIADDTRLAKSLSSIKYLLKQGASYVLIAGHLSPSAGGEKISTFFLLPYFSFHISSGVSFWPELEINLDPEENSTTILLENLRFFPGEESNDPGFTPKLASLADIYVNEAFAASHRLHASIIGVPKLLPAAFGFNFIKEVGKLSSVRNKPARPVTLILGGIKKDKLAHLKELAFWADQVLIGGKLPEYFQKKHQKVKVAHLNKEGKDINLDSLKEFVEVIRQSKTIVWAGPLGDFYQGNERGTRTVAQAIVDSQAVSIVGGGDTEAALTRLGLDKKISFICSGGGALLAFLAQGTLPGIKAVKNW